MKKRILSAVIALCLCISPQSVAHAWQEAPLQQEDALTVKSATGLATRDSTIPTPTEVYESMVALKDRDEYKEGTPWTDDEPYSDSKGYYRWKGGTLDGKNIVAVGCVAFAFILSDEAFGSLPARMYAKGEFTFEDIKAGDILRVSNDAHTVIVLEVNEAGVVVAEGNISTGDHKGKVHWGRAISKEEVMNDTSHYITRYPEGYVPPDDPEANVSIASGTLEGGLAWNLTKAGTLTISGMGDMPDYSSAEEQPWNDNRDKIRKLIIGDGVTSIGNSAFWNCEVYSAEISSSVETIGNYAFYGSSIISVDIPSNVKNIGDSAFCECQNLSSVSVSEGLETIGQNAFSACTSLTSIDLPASIREVGAAAFFQCQALVSATFAPGSKQVILGDNLFTRCYYLMNVKLPQSIDRIGEGMFQSCMMLAGVEIPQGAESIGAWAFSSCGSFTTVIIPDSVRTIGIAAFTACPLKDIYFTGTQEQWNSIGKIGDTASVVSQATIHYEYVPEDNPGEDEPGSGGNPGGDDSGSGSNPGGDDSGSGSNPGGDSSGGGSNPGGDSSGGGSNPGGDSSGSGSNPGGDKPGSGSNPGGDKPGSGGSQEAFAKGRVFTVGQLTYKVTKVGKEVELTTAKSASGKVVINTVTGADGVKYKVTSIKSKAMQNNKKLTSLTIGDNVKTIGASAFSGCIKLKTAYLGKSSRASLKTIGKSAFKGCKKLGKITIKSTKLNSVGKQVFKGAKGSLKVKVPTRQLKKYKKIFMKTGVKVKTGKGLLICYKD